MPSETKVVSAHRTPDLLFEYASTRSGSRGLKVIVAGAGGAAHLPGMTAAKTHLPVFGVPVESHALKGMDSLLSIVQMPAGVPVGTVAIGRAGAVNAALLAAAVIALGDDGFASGWCASASRRRRACSSIPTPRSERVGVTRVGIIGGGQLGRMLALAGHELGIECTTLDPTPASPAAAVAPGDRRRLRRSRPRSPISPRSPT